MKRVQSLLKITVYALLIASASVPVLQAGMRIGFGFNTPGFGVNVASRRAAVRIVRPRYVPVRVRVVPVHPRIVRVAAVRRVQPHLSINFNKVFRSKKRSSNRGAKQQHIRKNNR